MRKALSILLTLLLMLPLSACDPQTEAEPTPDEPTYTLQIIEQRDGASSIALASEAGFFDGQTQLPETLPVYDNPYAYGQEGALYEVTDALLATVSTNLSRYLECLYAEDFQDTAFSADGGREYDLSYVRDTTEVHAQPNSISILSADYPISGEIEDQALLEHALVRAAVAYLGLQDPTVTKSVEYGTDGTEWLRTYVITEKTEDAFQRILNRSFSSITVQVYADIDEVVVLIGDTSAEDLTACEEQPSLSCSTLLDELSDSVPNMERDTARFEVYYSATLRVGYFVPCYRVYVKDGENTQATNDFYPAVEAYLEREP